MNIYNELDQHIHQLTQTIAKFNRSYALKKADDSHTNLAFDPIRTRLLGRWVESSKGPLIMTLNLVDFKFEIFDNTWKSLYSIGINGNTQIQIEESIKEFIPQLGLDSDTFIVPMHYEITKYAFINNPYSSWKKTDLMEWVHHRSLANDACQWLFNDFQMEAEVRIWPHHFDTGIYIEANSKVGLGFGLAMQDNLIGSPYYYFAGYGLNDHKIDYNAIQNLSQGAWILKGNWKGAALKISDANRQTLTEFIKEVASWYLKL